MSDDHHHEPDDAAEPCADADAPAESEPRPSTPDGGDPERLEALASSLLWRIGRAHDDGPVTIRVGLASAAPLFAELPRLRAASDQEVEAALASGDVAVEWVGPRVSGGRG